jgi:hypothetical protein
VLTLRAIKNAIEDHGNRVHFGDYIRIRKDVPRDFSPTELSKVTWSVWDSKDVRQGANLVEEELTFREAVELAVTLAKEHLMNDQEPELQRVLARDVVPYEWALWSSVDNGKPFANTIVHVAWSEDGTRLNFGLDTHNYYSVKPDEWLELVPAKCNLPADVMARKRAEHASLMAKHPHPHNRNPEGVCVECGDGG